MARQVVEETNSLNEGRVKFNQNDEELYSRVDGHLANQLNPHNTNYTQVGAAPATHPHGISALPVAADGESDATKIVRSDDSRVNRGVATTTTAGLMSATDKTKLDGLSGSSDIPEEYLTQTEGDARYVLQGSIGTPAIYKDLVFYLSKDLVAVNDESGEYPVVRAGTISRISLRAKVAPTGTLTVQINRTTSANVTETIRTISLTAGQKVNTITGLSIAIAANDYLVMKVTANNGGGKLTCVCEETI